MARRDPVGIRLLTRNGYDWSPRYPAIVQAVDVLRVRSCLIDGGRSLATRAAWPSSNCYAKSTGEHVLLYAFDCSSSTVRTFAANRSRRARRHWPACYAGAGLVFHHACALGSEGIVSKRLGSPYRSGRSKDWLKFKNPAAAAVKREAEEDGGW
jgi:bifunctional non-homologous end joining protein LigD